MSISGDYERLREGICKKIEDRFIEYYPEFEGKLKLTSITDQAMRYLRNEWVFHNNPSKMAGTAECWSELRNSYRKRFNKRLELAIWYEDKLCCLMLGRVSRRGMIAGLNFIDANHGITMLKGIRADISLSYLESFAEALKVEWGAIRNPYGALEAFYKKFGYTEKDPFDKNLDALCKRLDFPELITLPIIEEQMIANF